MIDVDEARDAAVTNGVSEKQYSFVLRLARERVMFNWGTSPDERHATALRLFANGTITRGNVSTLIDEMLSHEHARSDRPDLTPGVYEVDGVVYVVKPNRAKTSLYAKRLVEITADRLNEVDEVVQIEFKYAPGAIRSIQPEHRMPIDRAERLALRYGRCVNCGRPLKAAKSVRQGIGPVCVKAFR